jgi:hypothetical protein
VHLRNKLREAYKVRGVYHWLQVGEWTRLLKAQEDGVLLVRVRVAQLYLHEEAVQLRLRQGEGAFQLHWVLRGDNEEGRRQGQRLALYRDLAFLHRFQKGALGTGRGAVDLIRQDDVGDDGAGTELELALLLVVEVDAGDVAGHDVRRELNALEAAADGPRDRFGQRRLADTGHVFNQQVPIGQQGHQHKVNNLAVADDDAADVLAYALSNLTNRPGRGGRSGAVPALCSHGAQGNRRSRNA